MSRKILAILVLTISISALAYKGYHYVFTRQTVEEKPEPVRVIKADPFAIKELIAVVKQLQQARTIDAKFTTLLVGEDGSDMGSFEGRYIKDSLNLYIKSIESENILNRHYFIAVDHEQKMMYVEKPELDQPGNFFKAGFLSDIDSLVNLPDSLVFYEQVDAHTGKLTMDWGGGQYYKTELIYDLQSKALKRVHLYPYQNIFLQPEEGEISDKPNAANLQPTTEALPLYVAIIYHDLKLNEKINPKWFDASNYFELKHNKPVPAKSFTHYEIDYE